MARFGPAETGLPRHRHLSRKAVARIAPDFAPESIAGAIRYYDCQVDDARLVLTIARTAAAHGAHVATRVKVTGFLREGERVVGVRALDLEDGSASSRSAPGWSSTPPACGPTRSRRWSVAAARCTCRRRKGIHLVVPRDRIRSEAGFIVRTETSVLFVIPWGRHWIIGTTDTPWDLDKAHPAASRADIDYVLDHVNAILREPLDHEDVEGVYAGLRPLLSGESEPTSRISREHTVVTPVPGLVMIAGGKLTTYRVMARDAVDAAAHSLDHHAATTVRDSITDRVPLLGADGFETRTNQRVQLARRSGPARRPRSTTCSGGTATWSTTCSRWSRSGPSSAEPLEGAEDYLAAEVVYAVTHEGARHLDDVLTRRTRISIETFDRGVRAAPAAARADGRRARLGRAPGSPTRSTTTCAGSRPSAQSQAKLTDQEADEARVKAADIV